jgi:hypothetical protein
MAHGRKSWKDKGSAKQQGILRCRENTKKSKDGKNRPKRKIIPQLLPE